MQVTFIAGTYKPLHCGVAHYTDRLRIALTQAGVQSVVLTTHDAAATTNNPSIIGITSTWKVPDLLPLVRYVVRLQGRSPHLSTDILHIQHAAGTYGFERAVFLLPLLLRLSGWHKPIVTTVHEYGWWEWQPNFVPSRFLEWLKMEGQQRGWWDREDGFLLTCSDAIITTNSDAERVIHERLPGLGDRLYRIPIAANIEVAPIQQEAAQQALRQTCNWPTDTDVIAFFGFLHPVKGLETLLSAFKQLTATKPRARLLVIGGIESLALRGEQATQYYHKLHTLISELGLGHRVHLTGYLPADDASRYLAGTDVGVLPFNPGVTLKSGSLLAMLAHGLPVVATHADPPDPDLTAQPIVRLVAPRDAARLAAALIDLLDDAKLRLQLGAAGRAFVQQLTWNAIAQAHLQVYQRVNQG